MKSILFNIAATVAVTAAFAAYTFKWQEVKANIYTAEDCVTDKWIEYESRTGVMPTSVVESQFRDECWKVLGAELSE